MSAGTRAAWLLSDTPRSRRQARLGQAYLRWLHLPRNRLAMVGLFIVVACCWWPPSRR
jgi:peptide/nickel transport system permease protein